MSNVIEMKLRPSEVVLDCVFNPAGDVDLGGETPAQLTEACGLIPDFFCQACLMASPFTLDNIAASMDRAYQFGGFGSYPYAGTVDDHNGTYQSDHEDDEPLAPLARFGFDGRFFCFVYAYGITAIREGLDGPAKIARFD